MPCYMRPQAVSHFTETHKHANTNGPRRRSSRTPLAMARPMMSRNYCRPGAVAAQFGAWLNNMGGVAGVRMRLVYIVSSRHVYPHTLPRSCLPLDSIHSTHTALAKLKTTGGDVVTDTVFGGLSNFLQLYNIVRHFFQRLQLL